MRHKLMYFSEMTVEACPARDTSIPGVSRHCEMIITLAGRSPFPEQFQCAVRYSVWLLMLRAIARHGFTKYQTRPAEQMLN